MKISFISLFLVLGGRFACIRLSPFFVCGPDSSVSIATGYGLDGPGIKSWWGRDFPHLSRPALGPTQPPVQWVPGLLGAVKSSRGMTLTIHPLLVPWSRKSRAIPLLPLWTIWLFQQYHNTAAVGQWLLVWFYADPTLPQHDHVWPAVA